MSVKLRPARAPWSEYGKKGSKRFPINTAMGGKHLNAVNAMEDCRQDPDCRALMPKGGKVRAVLWFASGACAAACQGCVGGLC